MHQLPVISFGLQFDEKAINVLDVSSATIPGFNESHFGIFPERGFLTFSWNTATPSAVKEGTFTLTVEALNSTQLKNSLALQPQKMLSEAYDENLVAKPITMDFELDHQANGLLKFFKTIPTPL